MCLIDLIYSTYSYAFELAGWGLLVGRVVSILSLGGEWDYETLSFPAGKQASQNPNTEELALMKLLTLRPGCLEEEIRFNLVSRVLTRSEYMHYNIISPRVL